MSSMLLLNLLVVSFNIASMTMMSAAAGDYTDFVYAGCSQPKYAPGSPYQSNVDFLLSSLANAASSSSYSNFTSDSAAASPAYGLFQCRGDLPFSDCSSCVRATLSQLSSLCPFSAGAAVQLKGCFLRYGNYSFLGEPDTSLLYKKCGPAAAGYSSDLLAMRDSALAGLAPGPSGGGYRVGAAGSVQAMAQCLGDQSTKQCNDCVATALAQLKAVCGNAAAGDAYLGQCYASYWSNGGYPSSYNNINYNNNNNDNGHDSSSSDQAGKTLAIIIGLIAGVALIIIFLSFLKKAGNYGKD